MANRRHTTSLRATPLLSAAQQQELRQALAGPAPQDERWASRNVAQWMSERLGRPVPKQRGGTTCSDSTPAYGSRVHTMSPPVRRSKPPSKKLRRLSRTLATAHPTAKVEHWATEEHRIDLK